MMEKTNIKSFFLKASLALSLHRTSSHQHSILAVSSLNLLDPLVISGYHFSNCNLRLGKNSSYISNLICQI